MLSLHFTVVGLVVMASSASSLMTAGPSGQSTTMPQSISAGFKRATERNMGEIVSACEHNVELQVLVLGTIDEYEQQKDKCTELGTTVAEQARKERPVIDPTFKFRRDYLVYATWAKARLAEALMFIDITVFTADFVKNLSREMMLELVEYGCDIICHGENLDKCQSEFKLETFQNLADLYELYGCRWRNLIWTGNVVNWQLHGDGHYTKHLVEGMPVIACKVLSFLKIDQLNGESNGSVDCEFNVHCIILFNVSWMVNIMVLLMIS